MDSRRLLDNKPITLKTGNVATRVGKGDLINLVGVEPDFVLSALEYGCSKAFLKLEGNCQEESNKTTKKVRKP